MAKWDIDRALRDLEGVCPGTTLARVLVGTDLLKEYGVKATKAQLAGRESIFLWSLGVGPLLGPKAFFHGLTIRAAYLKARKELKQNPELRKSLWLASPKKAKPKDTKTARKRKP